MKRIISRMVVAGVLAVFTLGVVWQLPAQEAAQAKKEETAATVKEKKRDRVPFKGKVDAVDKVAKTIKVGERTFQVTSTTRITKMGKAATLDDVAVGEEVGGQYRKTEAGVLELISLRIGPKPEKAVPSEKKLKKEKEKEKAKE